jgi:uncharacterized membrane protein (DUF106 family)
MVFETITSNTISIVKVFANWNPLVSILIISLFVTLISTLAYKYLTDQKGIKEAKDDIKKIQEEMKLLKSNPGKMMEKQKDLMSKNMVIMKNSFKPLIYTFIPLVIILFLIRQAYDPLGKIPPFGLSWFWLYFISSVIFSILLRKILKVY